MCLLIAEKESRKGRTMALKKWLRNIFYIPKHSKPTDENIIRLLIPSFVGIVICMVCLAASTWAWFSATVQTVPQTITAANYDIEVSVVDAGKNPVNLTSQLKANETYTVTLKATGTAPSGGYCIITDASGNVVYTSETLLPNATVVFPFEPSTTDVYTFTAVWGSYNGTANISENDTQDDGLAQEPSGGSVESLEDTGNEQLSGTVYVVQEGDNLSKIAQQYGTTVAKLVAFNNIENPDYIQLGWELEIPPENYELPTTSVDIDETEQTGNETAENAVQETSEIDASEGQQTSETGDEQAADTPAESSGTGSTGAEQTDPSQEQLGADAESSDSAAAGS